MVPDVSILGVHDATSPALTRLIPGRSGQWAEQSLYTVALLYVTLHAAGGVQGFEGTAPQLRQQLAHSSIHHRVIFHSSRQHRRTIAVVDINAHWYCFSKIHIAKRRRLCENRISGFVKSRTQLQLQFFDSHNSDWIGITQERTAKWRVYYISFLCAIIMPRRTRSISGLFLPVEFRRQMTARPLGTSVYCGKTADSIEMPFRVVSRVVKGIVL